MDGIDVIAIDIGNSKTDVALVTAVGEVASAVRGPTGSHQRVGEARAFETLAGLVAAAASRAGLDPAVRPVARLVACSAAGADFPSDVAMLTRGLRRLAVARAELVLNDCYGALRAGSNRSWGVCVVSGSGMNCIALAPDGRVARFDSLGAVSGDWGGGGDVGLAGLGAAVRAQDGRGPATTLANEVPAYFGLVRPRQVVQAVYRERIPESRLQELAPLVFAAAARGDVVARSIVDREADEVVAWATAAIRRARITARDPDVILAGGIFRAEDPVFYERIRTGICAVTPMARIRRLEAPAVVGAALLGLDRLLGATTPPEVERRLRAALTHDRVGATGAAFGGRLTAGRPCSGIERRQARRSTERSLPEPTLPAERCDRRTPVDGKPAVSEAAAPQMAVTGPNRRLGEASPCENSQSS